MKARESATYFLRRCNANIVVGFAAIVIALLAALLNVPQRALAQSPSDPVDQRQELVNNLTGIRDGFSQTFIPTVDNISGVSLILGGGDAGVRVSLNEGSPVGAELFATNVAINGTGEQIVFAPFAAPITLTPGNTYAINVTRVSGNPFVGLIAITKSDFYPEGMLWYRDGAWLTYPTPVDFWFRTHYAVPDPDTDGDGVADQSDNCPTDANPGQEDTDGDLIGDICDPDDDNDGVNDSVDNCPLDANPAQEDTDGDLLGNACDPDDDNDGYPDSSDNCPLDVNPAQEDTDGDLLGDICDPDDDNDGVVDGNDAFPLDPTRAVFCEPGYYGAFSCQTAQPGQYVATAGALTPSLCIEGTYSAVAAATACQEAQPGHYVDSQGAAAPSACPLGHYQPNAGANSCIAAEIGTYVATTAATAPTLCPAGTTTIETGSISLDACLTDSDGDGTADVVDPDDDNDGIADSDDSCPLEYATGFDADGNGCLDRIESLPVIIQSMALHGGLEQALLAKVANAQADLAAGDIAGATEKLLALVNEVAAQRGKKLTETQADLLTAYVQNVLARL